MIYPTIPPAVLRDYAVARGYLAPIADNEICAIRRAQLVELLTNEKATPAAIAKELEITRDHLARTIASLAADYTALDGDLIAVNLNLSTVTKV